MGAVPKRLCRRTIVVALVCLVSALVAAGASPASVEQPAESRLPPQIWAIAVDAESLAGLDAGKLGRFRTLGFNTVLATGLDRDRLTRLGRLSRRADLTLIAPRRDSACAREATCAVEAGSVSEAARLRRRPGLDLVVVRIPGAGALQAMPTRGTRILAVVKLRNRQVDARLWRRAIEQAADSPGIDLAVDPVGRKGEQALSFYLRLLAAGRRGDDEPPSPPRALTASEVTGTTLRLHWGPARDLHGVSSYRLYRDGVAVGRLLALSAPITGLRCGTRYRLEVEAADAVGNRSAKAALGVSTESCTEPLPPSPSPGSPVSWCSCSWCSSSWCSSSWCTILLHHHLLHLLLVLRCCRAWMVGWGITVSLRIRYRQLGRISRLAGWLRPAHDPEHFGDYANFGMNVFVGVENPEMANEAMIRANGMKAIIQDDERTRFDDVGSETAGWLLFDEVDMVLGPGAGFSALERIFAGLPQDGRFRYNNYGKGVLEWESDADAARFINGLSGGNTFQQVVSTDYYWFTDPNALDNPRYGFGSSYGDDVRKVRRLDALDGVRQPVWHFVELGWPWTESAAQGGRRILPAEIRSAVWHSLIAGARGIIYFDHNFGPSVPGSTILEEGYEDNRIAATAVNAQIRDLAQVLNAPFVISAHAASDTMAGTVRYMVKWANGRFYLFAGADRGGGGATFSIPCVGNATATVEGENRSLPVSNGLFSDQFADKNAIHIYRIDGGASCGLS